MIHQEMHLSDAARSLKLGEYEHYRGGRYHLIGVAWNSETLEEEVVYQKLYEEKGMWVRPLAMFLEDVEVDGVKYPRFTFVS